jgi:hypothetical protein
MQNSKKGQLNFVNLIGIVVDFVVYFLVVMPIYQPFANIFLAGLDITWQFYPAIVVFVEAMPLIILIAMTLGILNMAQPRYQ